MKLRLKRIKELFGFFFEVMKKDGLLPTLKRAVSFFKRRFGSKKGRFLPAKQVLEAQRAVDTTAWETVSICVPLYNTPLPFLEELLQSVTQQTCGNWQLCLADASSTEQVAQAIEMYQDARICYAKIENKSIAANTNAAVQLATGTYVALLDHDDVLAPHAIYEMLKAIQETNAQFLYSDEALFVSDIKRPRVGHFKPDFAPDYFNSCNYICHLAVFSRALFWQVGGLDEAFDGSQDHDLFLKLAEQTLPVHLPKVLYYWRLHENSTSGGADAKPYVLEAGKNAVHAHLKRIGAKATVEMGLFPGTYKVNYEIENRPLVSILIPNKDHVEDLKKALTSIFEQTTYLNFEVIVIENNSEQEQTFSYYKEIQKMYRQCKVVGYEGDFNFSAINNFGRKAAQGDYLLLLNNDVEIINKTWLTEMLSLCAQPGVGIVGAKLCYPDDTIQHAGVVTGLGGFAGHSHKYARADGSGYMFRLASVQNFSAVTAACLLVKTSVYDAVGGLEEAFQVAFNDVDFCLRVRAAGYRVLYTPYARLYHYESKSRGLDEKGDAKHRFEGERALLKARWGEALTKDPFYNPNLTLDREDFSESDVLPVQTV